MIESTVNAAVARILLADDHELVRGAVAALLDQEPDLSVVGHVSTAGEVVEAAERLRPDLVLLDIDMPGPSCFDVARALLRGGGGLSVVFLSAFAHDRYIEAALEVGASAYLTKDEAPDRLVTALRRVRSGVSCYSAAVEGRIVMGTDGPRLRRQARTRMSTLTPREREVLRLVAQGLSKKQIAGEIRVSVKTVDNHCTNLMSKLDIHDRVGLTRYAIREGLSSA